MRNSKVSATVGTHASEDIIDALAELGHACEKLIRIIYQAVDKPLKGKLNLCNVCITCKSKTKLVPEVANSRANKPGEQIFVNTTNFYLKALERAKYWTKAVDDAARDSFCYFLIKKQNR